MAKRNYTKRGSNGVKFDNSDVSKKEPVRETEQNSSYVPLRILLHTTYKITGKVSGNSYIFKGAGSTVLIDSRDVPEILKKTSGGECCGGAGSKSIFEIVR